uniref:FHA domain-containing protein n=1 Tax=Phytophthora ramorum TaxID=164328 RepID=H3HE17_PHYRM
MEAPDAVLGRRKRALSDEDGRRDSSESENVSPRLLPAQIGLPALLGAHAATGSERGRVTGAVKSRRLSHDQGDSPAQFVAKLTALTAGPASPALRVLAPFLSDSEAARTPSGFVGSPFELKKAAGALSRPLFALGGQSQGRPALGSVAEQKTSPSGRMRRLDGGIAARAAGQGVSPMGNQEQKSPVQQARAMQPIRKADNPLPTVELISHFLGVGNQDMNNSPAFGSLTTPYRVSTVTSTTAPSSKQVTKRQPFPFPQRRNLEPKKGVNDVSSDEELMGIPAPDIPDPEISFSQEKLNDLSVTENNLEETVPSPIMLGRDQFQDVFGDNIRGGMLSHLSRRHCLIHVENVPSRDDSAKMSVKVRVENTSTNGIRLNGVALKSGQVRELELDDIVTLLRVRRDETHCQ